jgi:hypothetical protein
MLLKRVLSHLLAEYSRDGVAFPLIVGVSNTFNMDCCSISVGFGSRCNSVHFNAQIFHVHIISKLCILENAVTIAREMDDNLIPEDLSEFLDRQALRLRNEEVYNDRADGAKCHIEEVHMPANGIESQPEGVVYVIAPTKYANSAKDRTFARIAVGKISAAQTNEGASTHWEK